MPLYRVQVALAMTSGTPQDKAVNTFHCIADDETALDLFITQLGTFYTAVDQNFSSKVATTGHSVKAYDLADPEPRAPVFDSSGWTLSVGATAAPAELAFVVSYEAPRQSGVPQARRRGRFYLGPLSNTSNDSATGMPAAGFYTPLNTALQNLLDASQAATTWAWAVYSRVNQAAIEVTRVWYDNAWDIQRRRGVSATQRTYFS